MLEKIIHPPFRYTGRCSKYSYPIFSYVVDYYFFRMILCLKGINSKSKEPTKLFFGFF